jgi:FixJ family two-component response regulator
LSLEGFLKQLLPKYRSALEAAHSHFADLTCREKEVATLIALGLHRSRIADALHISINSVESHTKSIYHKLFDQVPDIKDHVRLDVMITIIFVLHSLEDNMSVDSLRQSSGDSISTSSR